MWNWLLRMRRMHGGESLGHLPEWTSLNPGGDLFSHSVARAVSSALGRFTSVFGMGTGGATPLEPPGNICQYALFFTILQGSQRPNPVSL